MVPSLGWRSELLFARFDAQITEAAGHLVVRTPHNPTFYWGNFLLWHRAPGEADLAPWLHRFEQAISGPQPASRHVAFGLDVPHVALPRSFAEAGFELSGMAVMTLTAGQLREPGLMRGGPFEIRPLRLPAEAEAAIDLQMLCNDQGFEPQGYRRYRHEQMQRCAAMSAAGLGEWFGVWHQGELVADCGLFREGDEVPAGERIARFQHVETHPQWRRRGLCRALVHAACCHGFGAMGVPRLVMCADPDDVAIGIYESLGFRREGWLWQIQRRAPEDRMPQVGLSA